MQIQNFNTKNLKFKESKPKDSKLAKRKIFALPCSRSIESKKTFCLNKKKEYLKKKRDLKNSILATRDNIVEAGEKKRNK